MGNICESSIAQRERPLEEFKEFSEPDLPKILVIKNHFLQNARDWLPFKGEKPMAMEALLVVLLLNFALALDHGQGYLGQTHRGQEKGKSKYIAP